MAVTKQADGTFRVGGMTFPTAEQAFEYDEATSGRGEQLGEAAATERRSTESRRTLTSLLLASAAGAAFLIISGLLLSYWMKRPPEQTQTVASTATTRSAQVPAVTPPPSVAAAPVPAPKPEPKLPDPVALQTPSSSWDYQRSVDKMTGKATVQALIISDNSLTLEFPYGGAQHGAVAVRRHPQHGLDVVVTIDRGQMLCHTYDCEVLVSFDGGKPVRYSGSPPADGSTTMIFLSGPERFIAAAQKAKKILVQFNAYQNGRPILEFSSAVPLAWPPKT